MREQKGISFILMILMSLLCVIVAALLLFVPGIDANMVCYTFCTGLILWGILHISRFFLVHAYRKKNDYGFSVGVLLVVLGCCGMIRMDAIIAKKDVCFGMITLCMGILILQSAIQLNALQCKYWMADMVAAFIIIICSVFAITGTKLFANNLSVFSEWVLLLSGICCTINIIFVTRLISLENEVQERGTCATYCEKEEVLQVEKK